ncbi:TadE/TadG family type IV pilus assembly protein [Pedococcus sp. 2YAF34]|uniref:TadE/TadG family type IV pilus assembly protein n=1 Tax=Pedococcus sp. 2YAF34 TaxID=3233032 RepID=UPI003F9844F7
MVEAAIVTPVVFALLFGIMELGMLFKDYLGTQAMIRAGVRIASATPRNVTFAQMAADEVQRKGGVMSPTAIQELWVYKANATNDFPSGRTDFGDCSVCVKFRWDSGTAKFVPLSDTWPATSQNACTLAAGGPPDRVGVYAKVTHPALTGVMGTTTIAEASAMNLEPFPALSGCKP